MWFEIMKKELKKQKGVNLIVLFFFILSTMFLASSVGNIHTVLGGVNYYMQCADAGNVGLFIMDAERDQALSWLEGRDEVTRFSVEELCTIARKDVICVGAEGEQLMEAEGKSLFLGHTGGSLTKPLDTKGEELVLKPGQAALPAILLDQNHIRAGDTLKIHFAGSDYTYTVVECKDILYGNNMIDVGCIRFCESDYEKMTAGSDADRFVSIFMSSEREKDTRESLEKQEFQTLVYVITKNMYAFLYVFDMIFAGILIAIGVCLILISLLILRFSIVFTLEENYQEIGLMKALGMRNFSIRKIYLVKYLAIVSAGALIGFAGSIPVGRFMMSTVSRNMVLGDVSESLFLYLLCSAAIVLFVLGMCLLFTGKLKRISAITAIRGGETGERYHRRRGLWLHTKKHMGTVVFLGFNDVLCNLKRYMILLRAFCISFVLITIPLNTLTTMRSDKMVEKFCLNPESAVYISAGDLGDTSRTIPELTEKLGKYEKELGEKGYEASLSVGACFNLQWTNEEGSMSTTLLTLYPIGNTGFYVYDEGGEPLLANEIAVSKPIMEQYDLRLGDSLTTLIGGKEQDFLIVGIYTDYMQLGKSIRLSPATDMTEEAFVLHGEIMVDMDTALSQQEMKEKLSRVLPQYEWSTAQEIIDRNVGSIQDAMEQMQLPLTAMLCLLIMLICLFMLKLIIIREKGQIAMLKSIGFRNRNIRIWITMRMVWVVVLSMVVSVPLSMISNRWILTPIFGIMGARMSILVDPLRAYLLYPGILLLGIVTATVFATRDVKQITSKDMANAE
ncbi:MAG: ABC transporter permease [Lachnospiraceae bacterium]|nr:ABC transporter permease [Lachnospiraceae bacterium]